jgi:hypothetical protein
MRRCIITLASDVQQATMQHSKPRLCILSSYSDLRRLECESSVKKRAAVDFLFFDFKAPGLSGLSVFYSPDGLDDSSASRCTPQRGEWADFSLQQRLLASQALTAANFPEVQLKNFILNRRS